MTAARVEVSVAGGEPLVPESDYWFGGGIAVLALAVAASTAWRRSRTAGFESSRLQRVLQPVLVLVGSVSLGAVAGDLWALSETPPLALLITFAAGLGIAALLLFAILDFALGLASPRRTGPWLWRGASAFAAGVAAPVVASLIFQGRSGEILEPFNLIFAALGAACGIVWWAYLPPTHPDTVRVFE